MYVNKVATTINTNEKYMSGSSLYSDENELGYFFLDSNVEKDRKLIDKINNFKYIKLIIENGSLIDIVENTEKINKQEFGYTVVEDKPNDTEIAFAEYVLSTEGRLNKLESK